MSLSKNLVRIIVVAIYTPLALVPKPAVAQQNPPAATTHALTHFDVPSEDLGKALTEVGQQSRREIVFSADLTRGKRAPAILGDMTLEQALDKLFVGTGLTYRTASSGSMIITAATPDSSATPPPGAPDVSSQTQTASVPANTAAADSSLGAHGLELQAIVVTGTNQPKSKLSAPYAISTISSAELTEKTPRSLVDALKAIPGISVENSGGEGGGENVVIRGLPWSGFRLLDVLEDGLPLFESNYERELQIDELFRIDLGTSRVELVRGGTAPIYSNNASGGVVNMITNHGSETPEENVRLTGGSAEQRRLDVQSSGPLAENFLYGVSGFYREDNGLRDPGFANADKGGQFKLGGTYLFGGGKVWADFKYLDDRSIFYSDIPLVNPVTGASLSGLIDPSHGTLDSNSFRHVQFLTLDGAGGVVTRSADLADGVHPVTKTVTAGFEDDLGGGWNISDKARYVDGAVNLYGLFNGSPNSAATNLSGYLAAAQKAFPGTSSLQYVYAGTNTVFNPASTAGLTMTNTWMANQSQYKDTLNDLRFSKSIDGGAFGTHELTFGTSQSFFTMDQQQLGNTLLTDVKSNPDALDVQALNAAGTVTGLVTQNGFTTYGSGDLIGTVRGHAISAYAAESWHITELWQADVGVRHEVQSDKGERGVIGAQTVAATGPLAARTVTGVTGYVPYSKSLDGTSWTVGSSYQFTQQSNGFARYTSTYSFPRLSDQWANINKGVAGTLPNGQPVPIVPIKQAELGLKLALPNLELFGIAFWSHFDGLNTSTYVANAAGVLSNQSLLINTTTKGIEFEGAWRPLRTVEVNGSLTLQDPTVDSANTFNAISAANLSGKEITRTPKYTATLEPAYLFRLQEREGRIFTTLYTVGKRYQDYANTSILPAYSTLDLGMTLQISKAVSVQALGSNLTNSTGLTEGNARGPIANVLPVGNATVGRPIFGRAFTASVTVSW